MSGLPWWLNGKESTWQCRRHGFSPWVRKIPWSRKWQPTPELLPGESHGQRSLAGYSPWDRKWVRHGLATKQGAYDDLTYILTHGEITITAKLIHQPKKLFLACTNYQGNANQNHNEVLTCTSQDCCYCCSVVSHVQLFATPWTAARQASLSITISWSLLKLMFIELVMPYNHLIFCRPLILLPSFFLSSRVFSNELPLHIRQSN